MLELENVRLRRSSDWSLEVPNLTVGRNQLVIVTGANGSGKSTLLRVVAGLLRPDSGKVIFGGEVMRSSAQLAGMRRQVTLVHQNPLLFRGTVADNLAYGLGLRGVSTAIASERISTVLKKVELAGFAERSAQALSGGEAQRVAVARALVLEPELLLLDEPTSGADTESSDQLCEVLEKRDWRDGASVILTTHSLNRLDLRSTRELRMKDGMIREQVGATLGLLTSTK